MEKRHISIDLKTVHETRLNEVLRKFYAEVKAEKKAKSLTPSALTGIRAALNRTIKHAPYNRCIDIIGDRAFIGANEMFKTRCRLYYKANNPKPQHKNAIEKDDKILIQAYFRDAFSDPTKLQEYVWYSLCYYFGRRGREGWRAMKKDFFIIEEDGHGSRFVCTKSTEKTKNIQGGNKQAEQDYSDVRMYETGDVTTMNPVGAYELLLRKLNPENPFLFQKPVKNFVYDNVTWYTKEVIGKNTISEMMKNISKKAGTKKTYTNHCVRATTVTDLYQAGVDTQQICAITKHRNESTLKHYISSRSDEQKKHASSVLSTAIIGSQRQSREGDGIPTSETVIQCSQLSHFPRVDGSTMNQIESSSPLIAKQIEVQGGGGHTDLNSIFSNATFQNCVININPNINSK